MPEETAGDGALRARLAALEEENARLAARARGRPRGCSPVPRHRRERHRLRHPDARPGPERHELEHGRGEPARLERRRGARHGQPPHLRPRGPRAWRARGRAGPGRGRGPGRQRALAPPQGRQPLLGLRRAGAAARRRAGLPQGDARPDVAARGRRAAGAPAPRAVAPGQELARGGPRHGPPDRRARREHRGLSRRPRGPAAGARGGARPAERQWLARHAAGRAGPRGAGPARRRGAGRIRGSGTWRSGRPPPRTW